MEINSKSLEHYLTFNLGDEQYAISVLKIVEVQESVEITRVPRMAKYVKGILNLRGSIVPVVDLRVLLDIELSEDDQPHVVILELLKGDDLILIGVLVDKVDEVIKLGKSDISSASNIGGGGVDNRFIKGMVERKDSILIVLNIEMVIGQQVLMVNNMGILVNDDLVDNDITDKKIAELEEQIAEKIIEESAEKKVDVIETVKKTEQAEVIEQPEVKKDKPKKKKRKKRAKKSSELDFSPEIPKEDSIDELD